MTTTSKLPSTVPAGFVDPIIFVDFGATSVPCGPLCMGVVDGVVDVVVGVGVVVVVVDVVTGIVAGEANTLGVIEDRGHEDN